MRAAHKARNAPLCLCHGLFANLRDQKGTEAFPARIFLLRDQALEAAGAVTRKVSVQICDWLSKLPRREVQRPAAVNNRLCLEAKRLPAQSFG
jgi:hypothetical protein